MGTLIEFKQKINCLQSIQLSSDSSIYLQQSQEASATTARQPTDCTRAVVRFRLINKALTSLSMKRKLELIAPIDEDPCKVVLRRFKEKRTKILKQSLRKLKEIPDAEQCLRQAVLIRNTFIRAKDLSPKQFERQLLTLPTQTLQKDNSDLLVDLHDRLGSNSDSEEESDDSSGPRPSKEPRYQHDMDEISQSYQAECSGSSSNDLTLDSRQMVAVS